MKKIKSLSALFLSMLLVLSGCGDSDDNGGVNAVTDENGSVVTDEAGNVQYTDGNGNTIEVEYGSVKAVDPDSAFSNRDFKTEYDVSSAVKVTLADGASSANAESVNVDGDTVTITDEGVYVITGALTNGSIVVNAEKTDKLQLVLDGVNVSSAGSAALYVISADKVFVTLADESENAFSSVGAYAETDEGVDAAVYSKEDITFNGAGALTVVSEEGHGIVSKDDIKFTGGTYTVTAASHAVSANDRAYIADGKYTLTSGKDGIKAENNEDVSLGIVYVADGEVNITSDGDGIDASSIVQIDGGTLTVKSGGGSENGKIHTDDMGFGGGWGGGVPGGGTSPETSESTVSTKGIKSDGALVINGGTLELDCADDALHSAGKLSITNGSLAISTGDDGIHSDTDVVISGGVIDIATSYEGIEGVTITVAGGEISLYASDDGMNAAGGDVEATGGMGFGGFGGGKMEGSDEYSINILGGKTYVNADGDGIDSNGSFNVAGGEIYIDGPTNSGNGALDCATSANATGGICVAIGAQGMATGFSSATQGAMMFTVNGGSAGMEITVTDDKGSLLLSYTPKKAFSSIVLTAPGIDDSGKYTITVGDASAEVEMDGYIYGYSSGMQGGAQGGAPGGMPGGGHGRPGGGRG